MDYKKYFPESYVSWLKNNAQNATDITLIKNKNMFISENGQLKETELFVNGEIFNTIVERMCDGSIYAKQHMLKKGYLKLDDNTRVGVTGQAVTDETGKINHLRDINAINIRIPREIIGAARDIISEIFNNLTIYNTLIIGPPASGKTTVLKDLIFFSGNRYRTGVADERGELSEGFDCGKFTFIQNGGNKHEMMTMMLRSMSPDVIFTDEIGTGEDENAIRQLINAGVKIICTIHGYAIEDLNRRNVIGKLISDKVFERIVVLSKRNGIGTVEKIIHAEDYYA